MVAEYDYYTTIDTNTSSPTIDNRSHSIGDFPYTYTTSNYWWYTRNVYFYQILCPKPRCKGKFWGEVDSIVSCPKCSSRIKITNTPPPDYEVEVTT